MKHTARLVKTSLLLGGVLAGGIRADDADAPQPPNVLFIVIDDLRPALGCYGDPLARTPNMDRLARSSRQFSRAYCQQAVCGPSRTSLLTGRLPDHTRVWHNRHQFRSTLPYLVTLPQLFKLNGYHTQALGKVFSGNVREDDPASWSVPSLLRGDGWQNYVLPENHGNGKQAPFEAADVADDAYPDGQLAALAMETLHHLQSSHQPFFLAVGFFKPHLPFNAPRRYWDLQPAQRFESFASWPRTTGAPPQAYPDHLELGGYRDVPGDERVDPRQASDLRRGYYGCVSYVDAQVGRVLDAVSQTGLDQNTIVVLLGDHGYSLGEADHWCKDTNFELDTHVPLLIRTPGLKHPGQASDALTEYVDIYPTLAELAGLDLPSDLDGRSLVPILEDPRHTGRDVVLSQFSRPFKPGAPEVMGYSIRTDAQRYTRWIDWKSREVLAEELYDYSSSPSVHSAAGSLIERRNIAGSDATARERLSSTMDQVLTARLKTTEKPTALPSKTRSKKKQKNP